MPTMLKRKKGEMPISNATLTNAFEDWSTGDAYVSNGNYRLKSTRKFAPWNKQVRQWFYNNEHFHRAAQHYKATGQPLVPPFIVHENIRITKYPDKIRVEIADRKFPGTDDYDWSYHPHQVYGFAAKALYESVRTTAEGEKSSIYTSVFQDIETTPE